MTKPSTATLARASRHAIATTHRVKLHKNENGSGCHFTFSNGWTLSIQWGWGHYCDNYDVAYDDRVGVAPLVHDAEIAIWHENKKAWADLEGYGLRSSVMGRVEWPIIEGVAHVVANLSAEADPAEVGGKVRVFVERARSMLPEA